ncbi:hypothetical protein P8452_35436 [Trifolium repens]|nr:hypothetical protein P8452_35436 [Trifolium repens]
MVLIDEKGGKIHASIRKQLMYMYESKLKEGQGAGISDFGLTFTNIDEICAHTHDYEYLVDVIGVLTGMSAEREYVRDGKITKMIIVELTDHSDKCECALFGDYVDEFNKKIGKSVVGLPIVVIQYAKIKIFRDKVSIQNVIHTTRIFVNPDIPEVETFKNSIAVHGIELDSAVPLIGESAKPTPDEEFLRMHPKKTLDELVIPRFRVRLEVSDGKSTLVFVLFDSDMSYIMEKSCSFFVVQSKTLSNPIDLGSGTDTCGSDAGDDDLQSSQFVDDLIITPPMSRVDDEIDSDAPAVFKRNLSKDFDRVSKGRSSVRRKVKIEKD